MKEKILKDYFEGSVTAVQLGDEVRSSSETNEMIKHHAIEDFKGDKGFSITSQHMMKLCEDTLNNVLAPNDLTKIAFALRASDFFVWDASVWDGEKVDEVMFCWESPENNHPMTVASIKNWHGYLSNPEEE